MTIRTDDGRIRHVAGKEEAQLALVSPDHRVVAVVRGVHHGEGANRSISRRSLELVSIGERGALVVKRVATTRYGFFVRDIAFSDDGALIADVGGAHFAGTLLRIDPQAGVIRARHGVHDDIPDWVQRYWDRK